MCSDWPVLLLVLTTVKGPVQLVLPAFFPPPFCLHGAATVARTSLWSCAGSSTQSIQAQTMSLHTSCESNLSLCFLCTTNKPFYTIGCLVPFILPLFFTNVYPVMFTQQMQIYVIGIKLCLVSRITATVFSLKGIWEWNNHHNIKICCNIPLNWTWLNISGCSRCDRINKGLPIYFALTAKHAINV